MVPAHEGFEAGETSRRQSHNRLVVNSEFLVFDRLSQIAFELQPRNGARMHPAVKQFVTRLAILLRAIHRDVSVTQNVVGPIVTTRAERDTDTCRSECRVLVEHKWLAQFVLNPLCDSDGVSCVSHAAQKDGKLVATETCERVDRTQCAFETLGKSHEQQVAMCMAQTIVDVLETIEIEKENCKLVIAASARAFNLSLEQLGEHGPVWQARQ